MINNMQKIKMLKTKEILPNPYQIRRALYEKDLKNLINSIKKVGILSPIIVRKATRGYELICGQRRLRASILAGKEEIPAIIVRAGDRECAQLSFIENMHRKGFSVFEEAEAIHNLILYHKVKKECVSELISVGLCDVYEMLKILSFSPEVRTKAELSDTDKSFLKILLRIKDKEKQLEILDKYIKGEISMLDAERMADEYIREETSSKKPHYNNDTTKINKTPLFENTVQKTVEILKKYGAKVEFLKIEEKNHTEYIIKTLK